MLTKSFYHTEFCDFQFYFNFFFKNCKLTTTPEYPSKSKY
ncbi:unnamed protein product, partial [Amoebophrya sp. A120]|eukprot:GSA120T00009670001.1